MSLNKVMLIGRLGKDPEIRYSPSNPSDPIVSFSIATSEVWRDKNTGEKRENTEWHNCTAFGSQAKVIQNYVKKGSQIFVEGKIKTDKYTDKNGIERYATKIIVNAVTLLGSKADSGGSTSFDEPTNFAPKTTNIPADASANYVPPANSDAGLVDSDIPF